MNHFIKWFPYVGARFTKVTWVYSFIWSYVNTQCNLLATVPTLLIFSSSRSSPNNVALSFTSSGFLSLSCTSISSGGPFKYCRNSDCSNVPEKINQKLGNCLGDRTPSHPSLCSHHYSYHYILQMLSLIPANIKFLKFISMIINQTNIHVRHQLLLHKQPSWSGVWRNRQWAISYIDVTINICTSL